MNDIISYFLGKKFKLTKRSLFIEKELTQVKKAKKEYNQHKVSDSTLINHIRIVKTRKDELDLAFNPEDVLYRDINAPKPESGETQESSLFKVLALNLIEIDSLTAIAGISYGPARDDSLFEVSVLLDYVKDMIKKANRVLVVNPSPHMLAVLSKNRRKISYIVTDETIAKLYRMDYRNGIFYSFKNVEQEIMGTEDTHESSFIINQPKLGTYDLILVTARDEKIEKILQTFELSTYNGRIIALMPVNMLNRVNCEFGQTIRKNGMQINGFLRLHGSMLNSNNKHKILMDISVNDRYNPHTIPVMQSTYDEKNMELQIHSDLKIIDSNMLNKPFKLSAELKPVDFTGPQYTYNFKYYAITDLIGLRYSFPKGIRAEKYINIRYIFQNKELNKEFPAKIKCIEQKFYGVVSEDYIPEVEEASLDPRVLPRIVADLRKMIDVPSSKQKSSKKQRDIKSELSMKDLWLLFHKELQETSFDDDLARKLFLGQNQNVSKLKPSSASCDEIRNALSTLLTAREGKGIKYINTLDMICTMAKRENLISYNPIPELLADVSREARSAEKEIRNRAVKKSFEIFEEIKMLRFLLEPEPGRNLPRCVTSACWFLALIRLLTGISLAEAVALYWSDYYINSANVACLSITKYADSNGKIISYDKDNKTRLIREKEVPDYLNNIMMQRESYLTGMCGVPYEKLYKEQMIHDLSGTDETCWKSARKDLKRYSQMLIAQAEIKENILHWPDEDEFEETDVNQYNGDIFRSNFYVKACLAGYTDGELAASMGTTAYLPFEHNYCNYYDDMSVYIRVKKLNRWTCKFDTLPLQPSFEKLAPQTRNITLVKSFGNQVAEIDQLINVTNPNQLGKIELSIEANFGVKGRITVIK